MYHVYFSWRLGPTGYPGSEPGSGIETPPWTSWCRTVDTAQSRDYSPAVTLCDAEWCSLWDSKSDLIDPYASASRTHASKVCRAASAIVEGHISTKWWKTKRQTWKTDPIRRENITMQYFISLYNTFCKYLLKTQCYFNTVNLQRHTERIQCEQEAIIHLLYANKITRGQLKKNLET